MLGVAAAAVVAATVWFFAAGQFIAAEPAVSGPSKAPVFDAAWMKPVTPPYPVPRGSAAAALGALAVKGRASGSDYDRSAFGQAWQDADHNGCDTRNDILRRDLHDVAFTKGSKCKVAAGTSHTFDQDRFAQSFGKLLSKQARNDISGSTDGEAEENSDRSFRITRQRSSDPRYNTRCQSGARKAEEMPPVDDHDVLLGSQEPAARMNWMCYWGNDENCFNPIGKTYVHRNQEA